MTTTDSSLTAATGKADGNSIWGSGLLSWVTGLGNVATSVIGATNGGNTTKPVVPQTSGAVQPTTATTLAKYLPWAIGGVIVLALAWFFLKRK